MRSTGSRFENRFRQWNNKRSCVTFKFPDYASCGSNARALCDRVVISSKGVFWFELKYTSNTKRFPFCNIKSHQWRQLLNLSFYSDSVYFVLGFKGGEVCFVPFRWLYDCKMKGFKSVCLDDLEEFILNKQNYIEKFI